VSLLNITLSRQAEARAEFAERSVQKLQKEVDRLEGMFSDQLSFKFIKYSYWRFIFSYSFSLQLPNLKCLSSLRVWELAFILFLSGFFGRLRFTDAEIFYKCLVRLDSKHTKSLLLTEWPNSRRHFFFLVSSDFHLFQLASILLVKICSILLLRTKELPLTPPNS
jgi:hypothetical protein